MPDDDHHAPPESAEPGRARRLRDGLRRRAAEAGRRAVIIAVFAAVLGGLSGIAGGSWFSWRNVPSLMPAARTAGPLAASVLPVRADGPIYIGWHTFYNPFSDNSFQGGDGVRVGSVSYSDPAGPLARFGDYRTFAALVVRQMTNYGWHDIHTTVRAGKDDAGAEVTGLRGGYLVAVTIGSSHGTVATGLHFDLMYAEPPAQIADTVAGGVAGALLGVLLAGWTSMRIRRRSGRAQGAYLTLCVVTLLMLLPACLANIPTADGSLFSDTSRNHSGPRVFWGGFVFFGAEPLAILSVVPILAILVLSLWPRRATARTPDTA